MSPWIPRFLRIWLLVASDVAAAQSGAARIEAPDRPAPAPRRPGDADATIEADLERKRAAREKRDGAEAPAPLPDWQKRHESLRQDALKDRERGLLLELSLVGGAALTSAPREGYTVEPTTHFSVMARHGGKSRNDRVGPWYGLRLAPFAGSGFYEKRPGTYGFVYFGPIIGVGSLGSPSGAVRSAAAKGGKAGGKDIPRCGGWLVSGGIAAVHRQGSGAATETYTKDNDFRTEKGGVSFDAPGVWLEARWLEVLFGAFGLDLVAGVQTGTGKALFYGGIGAGGWY